MTSSAPSPRRCRLVTIDTPLGALLTGAVDEGVCLISFPLRTSHELGGLRRRLGCDIEEGDHPHLAQLRAELDDYFAQRLTDFTVPVVTAGTPFQERVWAALCRIPYGETCSYDDLARELGATGAQRAVGHANGSNPVPIVIPCHRVINKSGKLGGYGGELWRKERLLRLERSRMSLPFDGGAEG
jgi:AraC family transcriptional regulator of adaptative response/methylated-DNA-[protein]-cysteine methyltransferase